MATIPPVASPASTPLSPLKTSLTSSSPTTHRQTRSLAAANSAGDCGGLRGRCRRKARGWRACAPRQREVETAFDDPPCHRAALAAQSDEADAHQPASSSVSLAEAHWSTNDSTRRWYSPALKPTLRLCPLSGISLTTTRGDAVNKAGDGLQHVRGVVPLRARDRPR